MIFVLIYFIYVLLNGHVFQIIANKSTLNFSHIVTKVCFV